MVSKPEIFRNNSPMSPGPSIIVKKCSVRNSLCIFTEVLDVKKTAIHRLVADKSKRKASRSDSIF